ncbi:hypothetical protein DXG01_007270, partial [Tephrocybe rancida]
MSGRNPNQGKQAVDKALQLRKARDVLKRRVTDAESIILDPNSELVDVCNAESRVEDLRTQLRTAEHAVLYQERALGVDESKELHHLSSSPFLAASMNTLALKTRLHEKLCSQKFEMDRVERSFRKQVNEQKIHTHTEAAVKQRDPSIQQLVQDYNKLCDTMTGLITSQKAPD